MTKFVLGKKAGMTQLFDETGLAIPATVIECNPMFVIQNKTVEKDGYKAVKVATGDIREKLVNKPDKGQFAKAEVAPKRTIREFKTEEDYTLGQEIKVSDMLAVGDHVDVSGVSKGKGYQGNIKRHGQKGGPDGHGSMYHRRVGSMGANSTPARVLPGKKMPGHMGAVNCTVQNLTVVSVDGERGILVLRGAVPGPKGGIVTITSSVKAK
ncbi:MAG: 50S ribosomal protein L3 [Clostridiales bacterium]|nr:50S ribosomal protein L3 [Clostridiales bacterium]MBR5975234.1 50S ribosomal protein L3 [Clostridiales bacterium]